MPVRAIPQPSATATPDQSFMPAKDRRICHHVPMRSSRGILVCLALFTVVTFTLLTGCGSPPPTFVPAPPPAPPPVHISAEPVVAHPKPGAVDVGRTPPVINHGPRTQKAVALTFDADMTPTMLAALESGTVKSYANVAILDILQERQVPATFFITGMWAERYPALTGRIAADTRFEIANHTYKHAAYTPACYTLEQLPRTEMTTDAKHTFDVLSRFGGNQTRYFRFPGLCHDAAALTALAPLGVSVIDGDVVSGDPFATASAPIVRAVLEKVRPGSVIILHLTEANAAFTDEALVPILEGLAERGLKPVKLSELLGSVP